jgi:putative endopeptidase
MTHGFDDDGRKFDADGNLADWWSGSDAAQFQQRADVLARQFDGYEPLPGMHLNGRATLGENIADLGGVVIALDAFRRTAAYREAAPIAGFSPEQRFFLGYALAWQLTQRDAFLRTQILSDVHAPAKWRVNGPLSDLPAFYAAFDVPLGAPMRRAEPERAAIW